MGVKVLRNDLNNKKIVTQFLNHHVRTEFYEMFGATTI